MHIHLRKTKLMKTAAPEYSREDFPDLSFEQREKEMARRNACEM